MQDSPFWQTHPVFYPDAPELRNHFDLQFANPLQTKEERFCWDYWYVKDQYKLLRTPAYHFFPDQLFEKFESHLRQWGQTHLGCQNLSPMWLSYYIDGCEQQMHSDSPHGPWAFVYSLTQWEERLFSGGETFLLKPETLCYWDFFGSDQGVEKNDLMQLIAPQFNQLTVFDPRLPHGVQPVKGVSDPTQARIVIHGWFTEPGPTITGDLKPQECEQVLNNALGPVNEKLSQVGVINGLLSFKIKIHPDGMVDQIRCLANTLIEIESQWGDEEIIQYISDSLSVLKFSKKQKGSEIVIPFLFK